MKRKSIIITAGGVGKRMDSVLPKQFLLLKERPVLMRTIEQFYQFDPTIQIIITLPEDYISYWEESLIKHDFNVPHRVVPGGQERYHSIKNALQYCHGDYIAVHDGVRPFVSTDLLERCFEAVIKAEAIVPVIPVTASLRKKNGDQTVAVNRSNYLIVQTPQCFQRNVIMKAYETPFHPQITDDASLVEEAGFPIKTIEGDDENIKITSPVSKMILHFTIY